MKTRGVLSRLWVVGLVMVLLSVPMAVFAAGFSATVDITGDTDILVGETTTLSATWTADKDVTRCEWSVDGVGQGDSVIPEGPERRTGTRTFSFSGPALTGSVEDEYVVCFRVWHHSHVGDWDEECVTVTVTEPDCEWVGETAWAAGSRYVDQGNCATYTP